MRFKKTALSPGSYRLPDGRTVSYSRTDLGRLAQRAREMITAGLQIPVPWEHQNLVPLSEEEARAHKAKFNAGFVDDATVGPDGDLVLWLDIPGEDDAKRIPSVKFCSPEIRTDWRDGAGRLWRGPSLTHLALTPLPVQHKQKSFQPVSMSCVRLSLADREDDTMLDKKFVEKLTTALRKYGLIVDWSGDAANPEELLEAILSAALTGPQTTPEAQLSLAARARSGAARAEDEPWGSWTPAATLSPEEVRRRVDEHFEVTGREHG